MLKRIGKREYLDFLGLEQLVEELVMEILGALSDSKVAIPASS